MASILPPKPLDKVAFFENHNATWSTEATAIGTTTTEVAALSTKTVAARDAYNAQQLAHDQAKAATNAWHDAVRDMTAAGNDILKKIKAKAAVDGNSVYDLALIPPPSTPTPIGPPGTPADFTATLDQFGALTLAWKCVNPAGATGTIYQVSRQLGSTGAMQIIGAAGDKKFVDPTVPAGTDQVTYRVVALRSTVAGQPGGFTVRFGVSGDGVTTASVVPAPKLAA